MNALNVIKKLKLLPVIEAPDADVSENSPRLYVREDCPPRK